MCSSSGLLRIVEKCNSFSAPGSSRSQCLPFFVGGKQIGLMRNDAVEQVQLYPDVFEVCKTENDRKGGRSKGVYLTDTLQTFEERSNKVAEILENIRRKDVLRTLRGWRDETYDVKGRFSEAPVMKMERSAVGLFGLTQYGTHVNGYTVEGNDQNDLKMWIARRDKNKPTYPYMLDNMVAGGLASGLGIRECAEKECKEEADIPDEYLKNMKSVGSVSYFFEDERGLFPEGEYVFDLKLPHDFKPVNTDGEVDSFQLLPLNKVMQLIVTDEFKPNSALIALDFMIRHGFVAPDNEPHYAYLVEMMHVPLQSMYSRATTTVT